MSTYKADQNWKVELGGCLKAFPEVEHMAAVLRCHILLNFHISFVFPIMFYGLNLCHIFPLSVEKIFLSCSLKPGSLRSPLAEFWGFVAKRVGGEENLFCMIAYHFLVLVLWVWRWLHSLKSCLLFFSFYMPARGLSGATYVGTTSRLPDSSLLHPSAPPLYKLAAC